MHADSQALLCAVRHPATLPPFISFFPRLSRSALPWAVATSPQCNAPAPNLRSSSVGSRHFPAPLPRSVMPPPPTCAAGHAPASGCTAAARPGVAGAPGCGRRGGAVRSASVHFTHSCSRSALGSSVRRRASTCARAGSGAGAHVRKCALWGARASHTCVRVCAAGGPTWQQRGLLRQLGVVGARPPHAAGGAVARRLYFVRQRPSAFSRCRSSSTQSPHLLLHLAHGHFLQGDRGVHLPAASKGTRVPGCQSFAWGWAAHHGKLKDLLKRCSLCDF